MRAARPGAAPSRPLRSSGWGHGKQGIDNEDETTHIVVWTTLACRKDGLVDALFEVGMVGTVLSEEHEPGTRTTEGLVPASTVSTESGRRRVSDLRGGGDDMAMLERAVEFLGGDETADVGDVGHEIGTLLVTDVSEPAIVPVTGVRRGTADDEPGLEYLGLLLEAGVVDELGGGIDRVREGLEIDGGGGHLFLGGL